MSNKPPPMTRGRFYVYLTSVDRYGWTTGKSGQGPFTKQYCEYLADIYRKTVPKRWKIDVKREY